MNASLPVPAESPGFHQLWTAVVLFCTDGNVSHLRTSDRYQSISRALTLILRQNRKLGSLLNDSLKVSKLGVGVNMTMTVRASCGVYEQL